MDIAATLSAVTAAIGLAKELRSIDAQVNQAELKLKIADLTASLAEAKMGLVDVADQLKAKDEEITRLSAFDMDLSNKVFVRGFYLDTFEDGTTPRGDPYCPYCIDRKAGLFRLRQIDKPGRPSACAHCKTEYSNAPRYFYEKQG